MWIFETLSVVILEVHPSHSQGEWYDAWSRLIEWMLEIKNDENYYRRMEQFGSAEHWSVWESTLWSDLNCNQIWELTMRWKFWFHCVIHKWMLFIPRRLIFNASAVAYWMPTKNKIGVGGRNNLLGERSNLFQNYLWRDMRGKQCKERWLAVLQSGSDWSL